MFASRKVLATLHALSVPAELWEKSESHVYLMGWSTGSDQEGTGLKLLVPVYHGPALWAGPGTAPPLRLACLGVRSFG